MAVGPEDLGAKGVLGRDWLPRTAAGDRIVPAESPYRPGASDRWLPVGLSA